MLLWIASSQPFTYLHDKAAVTEYYEIHWKSNHNLFIQLNNFTVGESCTHKYCSLGAREEWLPLAIFLSV